MGDETEEQLCLLTRIAQMYHERGMRQIDIAAELRISQSRVSRLLKQATAVGIIRTVVVAPPCALSCANTQGADT